MQDRLVGLNGQALPLTGPFAVKAIYAFPAEKVQDELNALAAQGFTHIDVRGPMPMPATRENKETGIAEEIMVPALYLIARRPLTPEPVAP